VLVDIDDLETYERELKKRADDRTFQILARGLQDGRPTRRLHTAHGIVETPIFMPVDPGDCEMH